MQGHKEHKGSTKDTKNTENALCSLWILRVLRVPCIFVSEANHCISFLNLALMKVILFNPHSARAKHRIPNSILQVGAAIHGKFEYVFVDGNLERDAWKKIEGYIQQGFNVFGTTVMP